MPDIDEMLRERAKRVLSNHKPPYKLDLACGQKKKDGFLGVDINPTCGDVCWDLTHYPWPFDDNSVEEVYCAHFTEHLVDLISFMNELYRVCRDRAKLYIVTPYYTSMRAWQDPTHVRAITEMTFLYFDAAWKKSVGIVYSEIKTDFKMQGVQYTWAKEFEDVSKEEKEFAKNHFWNVCGDLITYLECIKGEVRDEKNQ